MTYVSHDHTLPSRGRDQPLTALRRAVSVRVIVARARQATARSTAVASLLVVYEPVEVVFRGCRGARAVGERGATAETFLDLAGDVQATAARLFVHRTTLYQRLDRIDQLYKLDLRRSGDHRLIARTSV